MKCPKCSAMLKRVKRGEVIIDTCDLCYGIWLDKGELEKITSDEAGTSPDGVVQAISGLMQVQPQTVDEPSCDCPVCEKQMQKVQFENKQKTIADKCEACGGMWFDKGEMIDVSESVPKD